jgi:uncharacterized protein YxjI
MSETESTETTDADDVIPGVALDADEYTVRQHLIRNKYKVFGPDGDLVLRAKQKLFRMKEEFPFTTPDGDEVFRVKAESFLDHAGDYTLTAEPSGNPVAVLEKQFTLFKHVWKVRHPDDERLLATIESRGAVVEFLRGISSLFNLVPHTYSVEGPNGERLGEISGRLSLRDTYDITIEDSGDAAKEALVVACIAIDALEGN